ncbi:sensor histidine kinase [Desulfobacula toluolica]|uniref:histidine kinase n=1 Tax=Desulfobacula toluolica (strain DSM 7467 / Tol2) TaxID=651182 RepID=K0NKJ0_DESTT|nr:PAS domain-containing sensor histidine kinase [Desulfobacula toluolica]CCK79277.1 two component system sensor histidine kinase [Desulfobacula toluolica Tol2]
MARQKKNSIPISSGKILPYLTGELFNFRLIWLLSFLLTSGFAIIPVCFFAAIDYNLTHRSMGQDAVATTSRLASNTWRSVSFFLNERKNALNYVVKDNSFEVLTTPERLSEILTNLNKSFSGFVDIGVIDAKGNQKTYVGPYGLEGKNYSRQPWFKKVMEHGTFISEVFLGYRQVPHLSIAIKHELPDKKFYILRATIEDQLTQILSQVKTIDSGDTFLINKNGILQTSSRLYGDVLKETPIRVPSQTDETSIIENPGKTFGEDSIIAYRYIPNTPFILMVVKSKKKFMATWQQSRTDLIKYLSVSITVILLWIWGITTYLVNRLKIIDRRRVKYFHMAEYANKMASIGRLAAGVAHEINNPLAIINEKGGLIKDLFRFKKAYQNDPRLIEIIDTILNSVERCSRITHQLLSFGRHMEIKLQTINLKSVLDEVLIFLTKEAEFRGIQVLINISETIPEFICDRGKLQQILLNIINNAFSAMDPEGCLKITANETSKDMIKMDIEDNGCGISKENLKDIFEPFFSTKTSEGGTGLGLSITYGLVQELGGRIEVESVINDGTKFSIFLPMMVKKKE